MTNLITKSLNTKIIYITGLNSKDFLQGILTNDINSVNKNGDSLYCGMFNNKGRYLFDMFVIFYNNGYLINIHEKLAQDFVKQLNFYKLTLDVKIEYLLNAKVYSCLNQISLQEGDILFKDTRLPNLGYRLISFGGMHHGYEENENILDNKSYDKLRYDLCVLEGDEIKNGAIPFEYGFDELNAISYNKGCYLGQEFTNACKNKLEIRKRVLFANKSIDDEINSNDVVKDNLGNEVASVIFSNNNHVFALFFMKDFVDSLDNIEGKKFSINNVNYDFKQATWIKTYSLN
jgi:folate-binding protein YgfZ